jgi:hypothetical protein
MLNLTVIWFSLVLGEARLTKTARFVGVAELVYEAEFNSPLNAVAGSSIRLGLSSKATYLESFKHELKIVIALKENTAINLKFFVFIF